MSILHGAEEKVQPILFELQEALRVVWDMKKMTPKTFLEAALSEVQSESIRTWAKTPNNLKIFLELAKNALKVNSEPKRFAAYMVTLALG